MQTIKTLKKMKQDKEKIVMITAYDYPSSRFVSEAGADLILVGDSLGMVILGYKDTLKVTLDNMIYHTRAVTRGAPDTFTVADLPYMSFHLGIKETKINASRLMLEGNANAVKLEGGKPSRLEMIKAITDIEIPVVAHLGLTPQSINTLGGYKVQGKDNKDYIWILDQAKSIEQAGAFMLVLEGIPEKLGKEISESLSIPTIGIGAGRYTDGQVLVYHDLLGMSDFKPKFVKEYMNLKIDISSNLTTFVNDVKNNKFPNEENVYFPLEQIDKEK